MQWSFNYHNKGVLFNYISDSNFKKIKRNLKHEISRLRNDSLIVVLNRVNSILRSVAGYYSFADNFNRLNYLKHFVDRCFWRYLVKKFRYRGIRRTRWVATSFFVTDKNISPNGLTWHLHNKLPNNFKQLKSFNNKNQHVIWCVQVSTHNKMLPLKTNCLSKKLAKTSYYIDKEDYETFRKILQSKRIRSFNKTISLQNKLLKTQKFTCLYCDGLIDLEESSYEVHHKIPIGSCDGDKKLLRESNKSNNLCILHQKCHKHLHSRNAYDDKKKLLITSR